MSVAETTVSETDPMNALLKTLFIIAAIGAINWGLVGFFQWNLVDFVFTGDGGSAATIGERVTYAIVGICGLIALFGLPKLHAERRVHTRTAHSAV